MSAKDVVHLRSAADEGGANMALAAKREARSPQQIARIYVDRSF
jgi:hypothetical protein